MALVPVVESGQVYAVVGVSRTSAPSISPMSTCYHRIFEHPLISATWLLCSNITVVLWYTFWNFGVNSKRVASSDNRVSIISST